MPYAREKSVQNQWTYLLLIVLLYSISLQFSSWGIIGQVYKSLRIGAVIGATILFLFSFKDPLIYFKKIPVYRSHVVFLLILLILFLLLSILGFSPAISPVRDLFVSLIIFTIGLNMRLSPKQFVFVVNFYIFFYTLAALSIIYAYAPQFVIQEQYLPIPKNQIAPAYAVVFVLSIYYGFKQRGFTKCFYYLFAVLSFASLLVVRGRAAIVSALVVLMVFILYYAKNKRRKALLLMIGIISLFFAGQYIYDALFLGREVSDLDSVSSGRISVYLDGITFLLKHPLGGMLESPFEGYSTIHNYALFNLVNYGVLTGCVFLIVYVQYIFCIIRAIQENTFQYFESGPLLLLILFLVSFFEYTYPYSPGSVAFLPFFLMGQYLQHTRVRHHV